MALTVEENPPELLAPLDDPSLSGKEWCVARTKSRQEKRLAWFLARAGIPYFLPMIECRTVSRNTLLNVLFPGNVFVSFTPGDGDRSLDIARESHSVASYLFTRNQPRLKQELAFLAYETAQSRSLRSEPRSFRTGDAVRVCLGPMMGLVGRVARMPGAPHPARLVVDLMFMGVHSMEINPALLEAL